MINKTRLLAGLALSCVLSAPSAFAEEYRGFYFGVWGGSGDMDFGSKADADEVVADLLAEEFPLIGLPGTSLSGTILGSDLDDTMTPWGAQVGFRFNKWVAAEVGYVDLGELLYTMSGSISGTYVYPCPCDGSTAITRSLNGGFERSLQVTSAGITAAALGMLPLGQHFDLHVRGGVYYADTRVTNRLRYIDRVDQSDVFNLLHRRVDASQTELFGGVGAAWNINQSFTLRVEYQRFFDVGDDEKNGESDIDVINVSVLFK
ncbi:outer membrane beta-barrel protein [Steroidobacter flavus]|uniref:Outer membrane beta-barrel protein n=1 Tax=Steroidobacter flavus TaxID=1842136 RepID=A0ABV8SQN5_9GAMM